MYIKLRSRDRYPVKFVFLIIFLAMAYIHIYIVPRHAAKTKRCIIRNSFNTIVSIAGKRKLLITLRLQTTRRLTLKKEFSENFRTYILTLPY